MINRFTPGCQCCEVGSSTGTVFGTGNTDCALTQDYTVFPAYYSVVINGVVDGTCTHCDDAYADGYNGDPADGYRYILYPFDHAVNPNPWVFADFGDGTVSSTDCYWATSGSRFCLSFFGAFPPVGNWILMPGNQSGAYWYLIPSIGTLFGGFPAVKQPDVVYKVSGTGLNPMTPFTMTLVDLGGANCVGYPATVEIRPYNP